MCKEVHPGGIDGHGGRGEGLALAMEIAGELTIIGNDAVSKADHASSRDGLFTTCSEGDTVLDLTKKTSNGALGTHTAAIHSLFSSNSL